MLPVSVNRLEFQGGMIEEFGGRRVFSAAFSVGYFDSVEEMRDGHDQYSGHSGLTVDEAGWKLTE